MRLHHLTVTAFGPFAGTEEVDFDALNDAGLFLLSGATGAGKTSILDAVCFALYGQVPGARGVKTLKSQHSRDDACPEVVLDFSVRDRRFVVRRSPEWTRPKRRGDGVATEKARAGLLELRPDGEHLLSSRAAEVGLMVSELVGMQAAQFQQVAMLPQGEFQRFLLASSQERHDVLQRLFHTDRFARIEDWVHEHSRRRRDDAETGRRAVQRLVDGVAERAGVEPPASLATDRLAAAAAAGRSSRGSTRCSPQRPPTRRRPAPPTRRRSRRQPPPARPTTRPVAPGPPGAAARTPSSGWWLWTPRATRPPGSPARSTPTDARQPACPGSPCSTGRPARPTRRGPR